MFDISAIFNRIETTFAVNAAIELFGSMMVVFAMIITLGMRLGKPTTIRILAAFASTFVANAGDAIAAIYRGVAGEGARWVVVLGNFFGVEGLVLCGVTYAALLFYIYREYDSKVYKAVMWVVGALGAAMTVIIIASQFTGWLYSIDAANLYRRGPLFYLSGAYAGALMLTIVIYGAILTPRLPRTSRLNIFLYVALPATGAILQSLLYGGVFMQMSLLVLMVLVLFRVQIKNTNSLITQTEALAKTQVDLARANDQMMLSQVRPHFIYNTLSAIRHIEGNPEETKRAITDFANYLRGNLSALSTEELIPVQKEMEHVRTYVELEKLRFGDKINVSFDVEEDSFLLPPLTIQMLVENAIKHGITARYEGGNVSVRIWQEGNAHKIEVADDGVGFDPDNIDDADHVGLRSVKNRLQYYVSGEMVIQSTLGVGTTITLTIPLSDPAK